MQHKEQACIQSPEDLKDKKIYGEQDSVRKINPNHQSSYLQKKQQSHNQSNKQEEMERLKSNSEGKQALKKDKEQKKEETKADDRSEKEESEGDDEFNVLPKKQDDISESYISRRVLGSSEYKVVKKKDERYIQPNQVCECVLF